MSDSSGPHDRGDAQQDRALAAVRAINAGANPSHEAFTLANDFTDRHTARITAWVQRLVHRGSTGG